MHRQPLEMQGKGPCSRLGAGGVNRQPAGRCGRNTRNRRENTVISYGCVGDCPARIQYTAVRKPTLSGVAPITEVSDEKEEEIRRPDPEPGRNQPGAGKRVGGEEREPIAHRHHQAEDDRGRTDPALTQHADEKSERGEDDARERKRETAVILDPQRAAGPRGAADDAGVRRGQPAVPVRRR